MKTVVLMLVLVLLGGCATGLVGDQPRLPYKAWYVGLGAPQHMEVWVESVDVIDQRGVAYAEVYRGIVSYTGISTGWPERVSAGKGRYLPGVDLPAYIFVRWQSLVEPQTYNVRIDIPEWVREEMLADHAPYCLGEGQIVEGKHRKYITIVLAPGGIAKVWVSGPCLESLEIGRFEARITKIGPYGGTSDGQHRPLSDEAKAHIERQGVPYGSW